MASNPPCPSPSDLKRLLDSTLPEAEQTELSRHLEACPACQQRLQELAAGGASWQALAGYLNDGKRGRGKALEQAMDKLRDKQRDLPTQDEIEEREEIALDFLDPPVKPRQLGAFAGYEIVEVLGRGGMGIVFKALDAALHRIVAVKVMAPQLAAIPSARHRFLREARAAAAVCHEHVVTIHAVGEAKGLPFLVMQFVSGASLQERLEKRGPLKLEEILRIGMQTAQGLSAAHAQGLVHRDIKPANILLENGVERVKITDFGLARAAKDASITQSGVIVGTPQYMAPEQARGEAVDHRADLFSLGSVLYFMCSGQAPFQGDSSLAVLRRVCEEPPPPLRALNPHTPEWLIEIIARLQAKEPAERFTSASEVAELLNEHLLRLQRSPLAPPQLAVPVAEAVWVAEAASNVRWGRWLAAVGALCLLASVGFTAYWFRSSFVSPRHEEANASASTHEELAGQVRDKLTAYCYRCHGGDGAMEGGFNYLMDRERLIARKKIVPGKPDNSALFRRIRDGEMPPEDEKPRPSDDDLALLRRWIEAGAPSFNPAAKQRPFLTHNDVVRAIRADLQERAPRDRPYTRYFTLAHLYNAGLSEDELRSYRNGVAKLLNSLSWRKDIVVPQAIDTAQTILRIDLRDYLWSEREWEALLADYPYGPKGEAAKQLPWLRGDWFVAAASRPPLYHQLLRLPEQTAELEKQLHVDVEANVRGGRVVRAGFRDSGVSRYNRLIERHESPYGAYWKSYDFNGAEGEQDLFARPLGPASGEHSFRPAGSEILFNLPNGLQGYMLADAAGRRLDKAPTSIVSDPRRPDRAVENGLSCMSCHAGGILPKRDEIRANVEKNRQAFAPEERETILALYPGADAVSRILEGDAARFRKAVAATGAPVGRSEPIVNLAARYEAPLHLQTAAAEIGLSAAAFTAHLNDSSAELLRTLGALKLADGTLPRQTFASVFADILEEWKLDRSIAPLLELVKAASGGAVDRPALADPSADAIPAITAPRLTESKVEVRLAEPFAQVRTGGYGRYLIFHLKRAKKLAVFDASAVRVVKEIDLPSENVLYACGRDKLMIVLPVQRLIQRWSLRTFEREKSVPYPEDSPALKVAMGCSSAGPLLLWSGGNVVFFDVERMEPRLIEGAALHGTTQWGLEMRVSADGRTIAAWTPNIHPVRYSIARLTGDKATTLLSPDWQSHNGHWALPNADGSAILRHGAAIYPASMKAAILDGEKDAILLPTEDPRFFLSLRKLSKTKDRVAIRTTADRRSVLTVGNLESTTTALIYTQWGLVGGEPRLHYLPSANVLLLLPDSNDRVIVRPLDLFASLNREGKNYLFVLSAPRTRTRAGSEYIYPIEVRSKVGGVRFKLESGPEGMTLSGGRLRWPVPREQAGQTANVIVGIRDASGQDIQHSFEIAVE